MHRYYSEEDGTEVTQAGLRVDLEAYQTQIFHILPVKEKIARHVKAHS
jgi:hypothetical protein